MNKFVATGCALVAVFAVFQTVHARGFRESVPDAARAWNESEHRHLLRQTRHYPQMCGLELPSDGPQLLPSPNIYLYMIKNNGDLIWRESDRVGTGAWKGPSKVGNGWHDFTDVTPEGYGVLFARDTSGQMIFYRHNAYDSGVFSWSGPMPTSGGWQDYSRVFSGGQGIVYAIRANGSLWWNCYPAGTDAAANAWLDPVKIDGGWAGYTQVFSLGHGILYGVKANGKLMWFRHAGYRNGAPGVEGPKPIANGWDNFVAIMPIGNGIILALDQSGNLLRYNHYGWQTGDANMSEPQTLAQGLPTNVRSAFVLPMK